MCGIVARSGDGKSLLNTLVTGLKRLEYRGYDSAGVALITDSAIYNKKAVGKIVELEKAINDDKPAKIGSVGIAHTRWATHGPATEINAHPHRSADGKIWVVHNGIIENYRQIKAKLEKEGIKFESETDTETVAKLIGWHYKNDLRAAVLKTVEELQGAFALCVLSEDEPERLVGVKMASPLVAGIGEDEVIIASDVSAIIDRTKRVIYLEDGELIDVAGSDYEVVSFHDEVREKDISHVDWDLEAATKQGFDHFLIKEIMEQPQVIQDTTRGRLLIKESDVRLGGLFQVEERLAEIERVMVLGVGTSFYAAKLGELYFNALSGLPATAVMSPEYRYTSNVIDDKTWLIAISQSGETADTIAAIEEAKRHGALATGIVNVVGSTVARITDAGVYNHIGPEISVASTKAFTSQSLLLLMHALMMGRRNQLDAGEAKKILSAIEELPKVIELALESKDMIEKVAKQIYEKPNLLYIGRKYDYPIALEGALKIKEISYIHAEGLSGGELKHGFIALIDEELPTIAIATNGPIQDKMLANIAEVKARKGPVIAVANNELEEADETIIVPEAGHELLQPIVNNVALQLLAYYTAKLKGLDIDQPRNLAKSVTVE